MKHVSLWKVFTSDNALRESWSKQYCLSLKQPHEVVSITMRWNTFQIADGCGEDACDQKTPNWRYWANFLVEIWADEEIQRQLISDGKKAQYMGKHAAKLNNNGYKRTVSQCKTKIHNLKQKYKKAKKLD